MSSILFGANKPQIALVNCSQGVWWKDSIHVTLVKGDYTRSHTYFSRRFLPALWTFQLVTGNSHHYKALWFFSRCEEITKTKLLSQLLEISNCLSTCSASFPLITEGLISALHPEFPAGGFEGQQLHKQHKWSTPCGHRWQAPMARAHVQRNALNQTHVKGKFKLCLLKYKVSTLDYISIVYAYM